MVVTIGEHTYLMNGEKFIWYRAKCNSSPIRLIIPFSNCLDLINFLDSQNASNITNPKKKFDIYITEWDKNLFSNFVQQICDKLEIEYGLISVGYGNYKNNNNNNMFKLKIVFDKFKTYNINPKENNKSIQLSINVLCIYNIKDEYRVNAVIDKFLYLPDDYDNFAIKLDETDNFRFPICEMDKIKKGYEPFLLGLEKNIKNKSISVYI